MNIKELKRAIRDIDDNVTVVVEGDDHTYIKSDAWGTKAEELPCGSIFEYYNESSMTNKKSKVIDVFVIS